MKTLFYYVIACVVVGVLLSTILRVIPKFPPAATAFLYSLSQEQYEQAYQLFSDDFKKQNTLGEFKKVIQEDELNQYKEVTWMQNETPDKSHAAVLGIMITKNNKRIPVAVYFVKQSGNNWFNQKWVIQGFQSGDVVIQKLSK